MGILNKDLSNREVFCHDNLEIMQGMNSECVDLIYLDPPFNTNREFTAPLDSRAAGQHFTDIFREKDVKDEWLKEIEQDEPELYAFLKSLEKPSKGSSNYDYCYLCYMAIRLLEMHRILKPTGSIYLHCDPTMSHYLKIVMDIIFGRKNFLNEVIWHHPKIGVAKRKYTSNHDILLFYKKEGEHVFNVPRSDSPNELYKRWQNKIRNKKLYYREAKTIKDNPAQSKIRVREKKLGRKLKDSDIVVDFNLDKNKKVQDNILKISYLKGNSKEYTGWETQKPSKLLEKIIKASSKEGDLVFDPFCGCSTACVAAEKLGRKWIGIDKDPEVHNIVIKRLTDEVQQSTSKGKTQKDLYKDWNSQVVKSNRPPQRDDLGTDRRKWKFVYVISNPKYKGEFKVGIASDVTKRLNSYQTSDPNRAYKQEFKLHTPFYKQIEEQIQSSGKFISRYEWVEGDLKKIIAEIKRLHKQGGKGKLG